MATNPTIVAASLDDKELRASVANLVSYYNKQLDEMVKATNQKVGEIQAKLSGKSSSGTSRDKTATKEKQQLADATRQQADAEARAAQAAEQAATKKEGAQRRVKKATEETTMTLDQQAKAMQHATSGEFLAHIKAQNAELQRWTTFPHSQGYGNSIINSIVKDFENLAPRLKQEIQRARNEIQATLALPFKGGEYGVIDRKRLTNEIAEYQTALSRIGASQTSAAQSQTAELQKQLQLVQAIASKKDATRAFEQITLMPANSMEEIQAKGQALVALVEKVKDTPLMSQTNVRLAEKMIGKLAGQYQALKFAKEQAAQAATTTPSAENATKKALEDQQRNLEQLKAREAERREQIIQTGLAAQEQARKYRESIGQQMETAVYTKQVDGVKELQIALNQMKSAFKEPLDSAIKRELEQDIALTQKALDVAKRYNMTVAGLGAVGVGGKAPTDTLAAYSAEAQRLAGIYRNLTTEERKAAAGQGLVRKYQELGRKSAKLRKELERPINFKEAMSGAESSIDAITHKIARLQSYKRGLNLADPKQAAELRQADIEINRLNSDLDRYERTSLRVQKANNTLTRSWSYMKNRLAFYFTVGASTQFIKNLIEVRSQYEMNERALGILVDSAERGTRIFNELSQMALVSPYTLIELSSAAKQLIAYDVAAKDVVDTTRRLADMASAVGIPMERLTYALGQIKAYGYLNSRDARMFLNAGIPLVKQLSEHYTQLEGRMVSVGDVYDRIKKKAVGYNDVMQVITRMTDEGGKFFDFQAKMADTLKVRLANLTLAWNNMLNDMGKANQGILVSGIGALKDLFLKWKDVEKQLRSLWNVYKWIAPAIILYNILVKKMGVEAAIASVSTKKLAAATTTLGRSLKALALNPYTWIFLLAAGLASATDAFLNADEASEEFMANLREGAKTTREDIESFLESYRKLITQIKNTSSEGGAQVGAAPNEYYGTEDIKKAWEAIREQIELSSLEGESFVRRLERISDVNTRVKEGFAYLEQMKELNALITNLGDTGITITKEWSAWWNLWLAPDGLIENTKNYAEYLEELARAEKDFETAQKDGGAVALANAQDKLGEAQDDVNLALEKLKEDVDETAASLVTIARNHNLSIEQQAELISKSVQNAAEKGGLTERAQFELRLHLAEQYAAKQNEIYANTIHSIQQQLSAATDERVKRSLEADLEQAKNAQKQLDAQVGRGKVIYDTFFEWMKARHGSAVRDMFGNMSEEEIKAINWSEPKWAEWAKNYGNRFHQETGIAFDELRKWVNQANMWSIVIPLTITTKEQKSVIQLLSEADTGADTAYKNIERLRARLQQLEADGAASLMHKRHQLYEDTKAALEREEKDYAKFTSIDYGGKSKGAEKDAKKAERDAAKARKAAAKAQREAESELQKTLNNELKIIDKVRARYKELSAAGYDRTTAIQKATEGFTKSQNEINKVFAKWGLEALDLSKLAGATNPREIFNVLQEQLNKLIASGKVKPVEIQALETKVGDLRLDVDKFDAKTIVESLDNALSKIKDEYELAIAFDESPELGSIFSSLMGLDEDYIRQMPRSMADVAKRIQDAITDELSKSPFQLTGEKIFNITSGERPEDWAERLGIGKDSELGKQIKEMYDYYIGTVRKTISDVEKEYDNLVRQRGEISDKLEEIEERRLSRLSELEDEYYNNAEMQESASYRAKVTAINNAAMREVAQAQYEAFKNTPLYVKMFEDLGFASTATLTRMKTQLDNLRTSLQGLSPQELKEIANKMNEIDKELIRRNPFKNLGKDFKGFVKSITQMNGAQDKFLATSETLAEQEEYLEYLKKMRAQAEKRGNTDEINYLDEKIAKQEKIVAQAKEENDKSEKNLSLLEAQVKLFALKAEKSWQAVSANIASLSSLRDYMKEMGVEVGDWLNGAIDGLNEFNEGVNQVISSLKNMDVVGALTGVVKTVHGIVDSIISIFGGGSAKEYRINRELKKSERQVKRLQYLYVDLQHAMEDAYGAAESGARRVALANKQLELQEIQRQIRLEKSRSKKKRDEDRILELEQQYKELARDIKTSTDEIVNDLLGNDRASFAENLVSSMIDAFRQGEDYMKVFEDSFDEMVDNMIMKAIVSRVVAKYVDAIFDGLDERIENRSSDEKAAFQEATKRQAKVEHMTDDAIRKELAYQKMREDSRKYLKYEDAYGSVTQAEIEAYRKTAQNAYDDAEERYRQAATMNKSDIDWLMSMRDKMGGAFPQELIDAIGEFYQFGQDANKDLSQLQQGIQGITETTANALEAYWNANTQQQYVQSDLLTQIRDAVVAQDADVQMATMGQILLQLQASYNVHMSIRNTLDGWSAANGMAVRVQMV